MRLIVFILLIFSCSSVSYGQLKNWNEPYRGRIIKWVKAVTSPDSADFIPVQDRIAIFDLDGTMITERPDYFHGFVSKRWLLQKIEKDPELLKNPLYKAVKENDFKWLIKNLETWLLESFSDEDLDYVRAFSKETFEKVPADKNGKTYLNLMYLPTVELLEYLKENGFQTCIVTTAQQEMVRAALAPYLKIPEQWILGSMVGFKVDMSGEKMKFIREKKLWKPVSHGKGKAARIRERIAKTPVFGMGNSPNDIPMLALSAGSKYKSLVISLTHDDPREYIYSRKEMPQAIKKYNMMEVSMKSAFITIYGDISFTKWPWEYSVNKKSSSKTPSSVYYVFGAFMIFLVFFQVYQMSRRRRLQSSISKR